MVAELVFALFLDRALNLLVLELFDGSCCLRVSNFVVIFVQERRTSVPYIGYSSRRFFVLSRSVTSNTAVVVNDEV